MRGGCRAEKEFRIGVAGAREEPIARGDLDDPAEVHHGDAIADVLHDAEVMRDEEV